MVWLFAGGVSLILPDVRFGTVSLDYVTIGLVDSGTMVNREFTMPGLANILCN